MMQVMIQVGTVTNAMRGKRVLEQHGIRAYIRRHSGADGCGYSLLIPQDSPLIMSLLEASHVKVLGVKGRDNP